MMTKIFPNEESKNVSTEFEVGGVGVVIKAKGMQDGQEFILEYQFGDECDYSWEPANFCCGQFKFAFPENIVIIPPVPGKYRLVAVQSDGYFDLSDWYEVGLEMTKMKTHVPLDQFVRDCCV